MNEILLIAVALGAMGYFGYILGRRGPSKAEPAKTEPTPSRRPAVAEERSEEEAATVEAVGPASGPAAVAPPAAPAVAEPVAPETTAPKAAAAKATEPKASEPKASAPKASEPKAAAPKASEPKASAPKASEPKAAEPKASAPKASEPKASAPKAAEPKPKAAEPKPKAAEPKPKAAEPKAAAPEPESAAAKTAEKPTAKRDDDEIPSFVEEGDELDFTRVGTAEPPPSVPPEHRRTIYQPPVKQILYDAEAANDEPAEQTSLLFLVHASAQTDKGLRRKTNQDSVLVLESLNLFVVADGMGGYAGGELASELTVKAMSGAFTTGEFEGPPHDDVSREGSELARAIQMANAEIQEAAAGKPELKGMGTTVCAAYFSPSRQRLHIGHVGDSRCYRFRDGNLTLMTADHTMAEHGVKGPESVHLSRAVGIWPTVPIDVLRAVPQVDDIYLLCSDGLTKMLPDDVIASVLRAEEELKAAVDRLILFANAKGGKDNISVILVRVVPPEWKPRASTTNETA